MSVSFEQALAALRSWCEAVGIEVTEQLLPPEKAGEFRGTSVIMNSRFGAEERVYYLADAIGSIVRRSLEPDAIQAMFDELRDAKQEKDSDPDRFERAIAQYRAFEIESSEFAVWLLADRSCRDAIGSYTNFMRADLEAMTEFHRSGRAPQWQAFFRQWNEDVAAGRRKVEPFQPQPIPPFEPVKTEKQEILQR